MCTLFGACQVVDKRAEAEHRKAMGGAVALLARAVALFGPYVTIFLLEFDSVNMVYC